VTAKAGLIGLPRALAHELAADNLTANCVVPGLIDTERDPNLALPQHHRVSRTLLGRLGSAEEIAAAVCFLCGPGARYITARRCTSMAGCISADRPPHGGGMASRLPRA
jgi:3-oxoacyl-[acyl-carrier protein] reductase